ncbi:MAG: NYN domain-containing protein, partial [Chloroflexus sp.]
MYDQKRPDVAVFIDFENIYVSVRDKLNATPNFEAIMDRCNDLGRVVISRAYADWYRYPRITSALYANAIEPIYVATYYYDKDAGRTGRAIKNSVDMNLCIDAMKTLFIHPNVGRFVLVTGDRDFIPLVHSIRQQGKEVYIIGIGGAASTHLAQSADEFVFYEQLIGRQPNASVTATAIASRATELNRAIEAAEIAATPIAPTAPMAPVAPVAPPPAEPDIYEVLVQAIHLARKRGYVTTLGSLKMLMKELMGGDFKESRYRDLNGRPYTKFKDLVMDAEQRGKVQIFTKGSVNEVFLPGEDPLKLSRFAPLLTEELPPEPVVLDPPVGSNGGVQLAEISPVVIEEVKVAVAETPVTAAPNGSRRRR